MRHIITAEEVAVYGRPVSTDKSTLDSTINEVEAEEIRPRLGDALFVALTADGEPAERFGLLLEGGSWTDNAGHVRYCMGLKRAAAYFVYARVLRDGNIQATRYGAVNKTNEHSTEPVIAERRRMYEEFFATADRYLKDCLLYLAASGCEFPEYNQGAAMKSNRNAIRVVGSGAPARSPKPQGVTVIAGAPGESAYEIAVRLGFRGSEEDWLAALPYTMAVALGYRGTREEWLASLPYLMAVYEGYTGTSSQWLVSMPYRLAVALGFEGSEQDWLDSLQASVTAQGVRDALGYTPADDAGVVKLEGNQTVHGLKSFSDGLRVDDPSAILFMSQSQTLAQIIAAIQATLGDINGKIPAAASASNPLVDRQTLEESIAFNTGHYISNNGQPFTSVAQLEDYPKSQLTNNDYAVVTGTDEDGHITYTYYVYSSQGLTWAKEFTIDTFLDPFTPEQLAALNSGITAAILQALQSGKADKADVNLIGRNVNYTDKMSDLAPDLHAIAQATSVINVLDRGRVEACILPTTEITRGWLYEYEEGWRLARIGGFTMTADSTWDEFLDFMDLEGNSAMLVGADYIGELSDLTTQNKGSIVEAINEVNAKDPGASDVSDMNALASMVVATPTQQSFIERATPAGGIAYIPKVYGNSVVWNQGAKDYLEPANIVTLDGSSISYNGRDIHITFASASSAAAVGLRCSAFIAGHKILLHFNNENSIPLTSTKLGSKDSVYSGGTTSIFQGGYEVLDVITYGDGTLWIWPSEADKIEGDFSDFWFTDLTQMFGAGNEPTTYEEFLQRKPKVADEYAYNEGEIINFTATGIESRNAAGAVVASLPLNLSGIVRTDGTQLFPDGLLSAGSVRDMVDRVNGRAEKNVGFIAFNGTESWRTSILSDVARHQLTISTAKSDLIGGIIASLYPESRTHVIETPKESGYYFGWYGDLMITDSNYQDAESWKAHLAELHAAGTPLVALFVLAEPETVTFSPMKAFYKTEQGGTERITGEDSAPIVADMGYKA